MPLKQRNQTPGVVVAVTIPSMGQIDLFENYSYLIGPCAKKPQPF